MRTINRHLNIIKRSGLALLVAAVFGLGLSNTLAHADNVSFQTVRQCDAKAVISCGALTTGQLASAYNNSPYTQKVYAYSGISGQDIKNLASTAAAGHVDKNGNVYLDGRSSPVAANTITGGRQNIPGSKAVSDRGIIFYSRPLSVAMTNNSADAFVVMGKGGFQYAIIASNGDPVTSAIAKPAPKKPAVPAVPVPLPPATGTAPGQLVNTGPISTAAIMLVAASIVAGTVASYRYQLKKLRKSS